MKLQFPLFVALLACTGMVQAQLPPVQTQGDISFISGGIGLEESQAMQEARKSWPVSIMFSEVSNSKAVWVSDVELKILDAKGQALLSVTSAGPLLLVQLKPGDYTLQARYLDKPKSQKFTVKANAHERVSVFWVVRPAP